MSTYTETQISDLINKFNEATETPAPTTRRTAIVENVTAPDSGYRVVIAGHSFDVEAHDRGMAVLMAAAIAKVSGTLPNVSGYLFMWNYSVTDEHGVTVDGRDMREEVQSARMATR